MSADVVICECLARDGLQPDSVPLAGQVVALRSAANLSLGGLAEDVTDEVHPEVARTVERACRLVRLDMAGVDLITTDITRPLAETGGAILELNGRPGLRPHYHKDYYGAFVRDPDGHNIEAVCHKP